MTITYPLDLPSATGLARIRIAPGNVNALLIAPYGREQQLAEFTGKWWEAEIGLPPLNPVNAAAWEAFILKLNGRKGSFLLGDPMRATPRGTAASSPGSPVVSGGHAARISTLSISGAPASQTGWLLEADQIQIGSGAAARLHSVLVDADTDGSGLVTLDIWPTLRAALSGGEAITVSSPKGVFRLADDVNYFERSRGPRTDIAFKCLEVLT